jgi:hypothetical protein
MSEGDAMTATTRTPGYDHRINIWFQTTKRGQRVAYYWSYAAGRAIRIGLADAELFIATERADQVSGHPFKN